jgi:hypothetical protein
LTVSFISTHNTLPLIFSDVAWSQKGSNKKNIEQPMLLDYKKCNKRNYYICDLRQKTTIINDKCAVSVSGDQGTALEFVRNLIKFSNTINDIADIKEIMENYRYGLPQIEEGREASIIGIIVSDVITRFKVDLPSNILERDRDFIVGSGSDVVNRVIGNSDIIDLSENNSVLQINSFACSFASYLISVDVATSEPQNNYFGGAYSALYFYQGKFHLNSSYTSVYAEAHYVNGKIKIIPRSSRILDFGWDQDNMIISTYIPKSKKALFFRQKYIARKWIVPSLTSNSEYQITSGNSKYLQPSGKKPLTICIDVYFGKKVCPITKHYSEEQAKDFVFNIDSSSNMVSFPEDFLLDLKDIFLKKTAL